VYYAHKLKTEKLLRRIAMILNVKYSGIMKKSQILLLLTFLIVLLGQASGEVTLDVDVPPGWMGDALFDEDWGYWGYSTENSFVMIYYDTDVPEELIGQEDNPDAFVFWSCGS